MRGLRRMHPASLKMPIQMFGTRAVPVQQIGQARAAATYGIHKIPDISNFFSKKRLSSSAIIYSLCPNFDLRSHNPPRPPITMLNKLYLVSKGIYYVANFTRFRFRFFNIVIWGAGFSRGEKGIYYGG